MPLGILMSDEGSRLQPENKGLNSGPSNTIRCKQSKQSIHLSGSREESDDNKARLEEFGNTRGGSGEKENWENREEVNLINPCPIPFAPGALGLKGPCYFRSHVLQHTLTNTYTYADTNMDINVYHHQPDNTPLLMQSINAHIG